MDAEKLEQEFHDEMRHRSVREVHAVTGYRSSRIIQMIDSYGALETVKLLKQQYPKHDSEGYTQLFMCRRLDLSFEALMLDDRFVSLFSKEELEWARSGLPK